MMLTEHFSDVEFLCHDGTPVPSGLQENLNELAHLCQAIRNVIGSRLRVVSGYRTPKWNRRVKGARDSAHVTAEAADLRLYDGTAAQLHDAILGAFERGKGPTTNPDDLLITARLGGLGIYPGWVHVDTRILTSGRLRQWAGAGVGSEPALKPRWRIWR